MKPRDPSTASSTQPHPVDIHVGTIVRRLRRARGLSQELLAARIGVTFQQVEKYERGTNRISASMLYEIAGALDASIASFYDGLATPGRRKGDDANLQGLIQTLLSHEGGLDLAEGFARIPSPELRRTVVQLVTGMARLDGASPTPSGSPTKE